MKYRTILDIAKILFANIGNILFCGGTSLNTFYLDYRYSEDLDIGYIKKNPKSEIEYLLRKKGYSIERTALKIRDIVSVGGVEIKMDIFEYKPLLGTEERNLEGVEVTIPSLEDFTISKTISFLTRENILGLARDAYDIYMIHKISKNTLNFLKKYKNKIKKEVPSIKHNFDLFYKNKEQIEQSINYLLKEQISYEKVLKFLKETERCFQ